MAALPDRYTDPLSSRLTDLREVTVEQLSPLLEEETEAWSADLDWDFLPSADLVRRFVQVRALNGFALMDGGSAAGYAYFVAEDGKGLIGDFYVRAAQRNVENENLLLGAVLESMWRTSGLRRVEAQLMMLSSHLDRAVPYQPYFHSYARCFLEARLAAMASLPARQPPGVSFALWTENRQDDAARLIAASYRGHIDSHINDQYRSPAGARRFLANIVQYPGCGSFFAPASFLAWDQAQRTLCGISLSSLVAPEVGHITQICVAPSHQGRGIGYELLRRSLAALAGCGCRKASLTVTSANAAAIRLYQRVGFQTRRDFAAYVWERR